MKELTITPPEGYEIDKKNSTFEKIVFKPIGTKPRSWEEYCKRTILGGQSYIHNDGWIQTIIENNIGKMDEVRDRMVLPSKELAEAFLAMMQLMSLRQAWIGDWKPDFNSCVNEKWCIEVELDEVRVVPSPFRHYALSFPTLEMALDFKDYFKDLLEQAKPLL